MQPSNCGSHSRSQGAAWQGPAWGAQCSTSEDTQALVRIRGKHSLNPRKGFLTLPGSFQLVFCSHGRRSIFKKQEHPKSLSPSPLRLFKASSVNSLCDLVRQGKAHVAGAASSHTGAPDRGVLTDGSRPWSVRSLFRGKCSAWVIQAISGPAVLNWM